MSRENISSAGTEQAVDGNFSGDSRASPRRRRLNGAKIVFNNNASVIDCVVRDISPQGARIRVASPIGIPDRFDLRIDRSGTTYPSKVAWRSNDQIGVTFDQRITLP
jgi:hypothetical protein